MDSSDLRKLVRLQAKQTGLLLDLIEGLEADLLRTQEELDDYSETENLRPALAEKAAKLATVEHAHAALKERVQQLEREARDRKGIVRRRIEAALGEYTGDWLQEAEERLTRRREISPTEVGRVITSAVASARGDLAKLAYEVCEYLAVTLPKDGP